MVIGGDVARSKCIYGWFTPGPSQFHPRDIYISRRSLPIPIEFVLVMNGIINLVCVVGFIGA